MQFPAHVCALFACMLLLPIFSQADTDSYDSVPDAPDAAPLNAASGMGESLVLEGRYLGARIQEHTASNENQTPVCTYSIAPASKTITNACALQTSNASVTVSAGCAWSAVTSTGQTGWLRMVAGGSAKTGTGSGQSISYSTASNRHQDARTGSITVLDGNGQATTAVLTVTQVHGHACP